MANWNGIFSLEKVSSTAFLTSILLVRLFHFLSISHSQADVRKARNGIELKQMLKNERKQNHFFFEKKEKCLNTMMRRFEDKNMNKEISFGLSHKNDSLKWEISRRKSERKMCVCVETSIETTDYSLNRRF